MLDSLYNTLPSKVKRQIPLLVHTPTKTSLIFLDVAQQRGSSDCGLYAISNAFDVGAGLDVTTLKYTQKNMHQHLLKCLEADVITPFPCQKMKTKVLL